MTARDLAGETGLTEEAAKVRRFLWARFVNLDTNPPRLVRVDQAPDDPPADHHVAEALRAAYRAGREAKVRGLVSCKEAAAEER